MQGILGVLKTIWTVIKVVLFAIIALIYHIYLSFFGDLNYKGGNSDALNGHTVKSWWWVETYEECLDAIDQLDAKDSTFKESAIFSYEGEEFDVKYCFILDKRVYLKYGRDNPFKFKSEDVEIIAFIFPHGVNIDDLAYKSVDRRCRYFFKLSPEYIEGEKYKQIDAESLTMSWGQPPQIYSDMTVSMDYKEAEASKPVFRLVGDNQEKMPELSNEVLNKILDSIVIISGN